MMGGGRSSSSRSRTPTTRGQIPPPPTQAALRGPGALAARGRRCNQAALRQEPSISAPVATTPLQRSDHPFRCLKNDPNIRGALINSNLFDRSVLTDEIALKWFVAHDLVWVPKPKEVSRTAQKARSLGVSCAPNRSRSPRESSRVGVDGSHFGHRKGGRGLTKMRLEKKKGGLIMSLNFVGYENEARKRGV